jgi:hypothetical protein
VILALLHLLWQQVKMFEFALLGIALVLVSLLVITTRFASTGAHSRSR